VFVDSACGAIVIVRCAASHLLSPGRQFEVPSEDAGKSIPEFARQLRSRSSHLAISSRRITLPFMAPTTSCRPRPDAERDGLKAGVRQRERDISLLEAKKSEESKEMSPKNSTPSWP